jgi:hypothetical protein
MGSFFAERLKTIAIGLFALLLLTLAVGLPALSLYRAFHPIPLAQRIAVPTDWACHSRFQGGYCERVRKAPLAPERR